MAHIFRSSRSFTFASAPARTEGLDVVHDVARAGAAGLAVSGAGMRLHECGALVRVAVRLGECRRRDKRGGQGE